MPTVVTVAPTETVVLTQDIATREDFSVQVVNLDPAQTFAGTVYVRAQGETAWAPADYGAFSAVAPLASVLAPMPVKGIAAIELRGTMSGAGGDVRVTAN